MTTEGDHANSLELGLAAAAAANDKKARDLVLMDMRELVDYTDYMLVCTGATPRQTGAIAEEVRQRLRQDLSAPVQRIEGQREGEWILIDLLDVVVHVFTPEAREFYRLDRLWRQAPRESLEALAS